MALRFRGEEILIIEQQAFYIIQDVIDRYEEEKDKKREKETKRKMKRSPKRIR